MKRLSVGTLILAVCGWLPGHPADAGQPSTRIFRAGAFAADVSPTTFPVLINGSMVSRTASQIVDPLHARCLVLDDGHNQIVISVVDSCMIPRELLDQAKHLAQAATGIPVDRILISATHTHSAPSVHGCLGTNVDRQYALSLPSRIARGIQFAYERLQPARVGWAVANEPDNVHCRRWFMRHNTALKVPFTGHAENRVQMNPGHGNGNKIRPVGEVDDAVSILSLQTPDAEPIAILANYSTHYAGAPSVSADYFGVFAERMETLIGIVNSSFVAIMSNGTSGDANCFDFQRESKRNFDRFSVARDVASAAMRAYRKIEYHDWVPISMLESEVELQVRMPSKDEVEHAQAFLDNEMHDSAIAKVYARETVLLSRMAPVRRLKLQAIRIGSMGITAIPNEVFGSTGLRIKRDSPLKPTMNISLANGCEGYIAPPEQHLLGGYTTWRARTSCLEVQAEPKIRAELQRLLDYVARIRADSNTGLR